MRIGVPKEIKTQEFRVGLTPDSVQELVSLGHRVIVESGAGAAIGMDDGRYGDAGASIVSSPTEIFGECDLIVKVKEPQSAERRLLRPGQILFTYLHLAPDANQAKDLCDSGATCIAYETVTSPRGGLPLLAPMSEVAGRMAVQVGAYFLEKAHGGSGVLLGGVPGVPGAKVVVLGGGVAGTHAADVAAGMGAEVVVIDRDMDVLRSIWRQFGRRVKTAYSTQGGIRMHCSTADLVIGSVLIPGASAPKLVTKDLIASMKPGAVVVDVAIDQGGCFETSRPTTHDMPTYVVDSIVHYCVANMPGAVALTSTIALNNATLPYVVALASQGLHRALKADPHFLRGLNIFESQVTHPAVAESLKMPYVDPEKVLA